MLKTRKIKKKPSKPRKNLFYEVASGFVKFGDNVKKYYNINKTSSNKGRFIQKTA